MDLSQEQLYDKALQTVGAVAKFPVVRVNREDFLRKQFSDSPYLDEIIANGPQAVYSINYLTKLAEKIVESCTNKTAATSFITGLPGNPVMMVAAGGADIVQYFGFAINMAQQIAYLFGEDDLFLGESDEISEQTKFRLIVYLGIMFGAGGAASLISSVSRKSSQIIAKRVATKPLTKTVWYPVFKKVATNIGQKITKKTVEKTITKALPVVGGVISSGITYITFKPMGKKLIQALVDNLNDDTKIEPELNPEFAKKIKHAEEINDDFIEADFTELDE